MPKAIPPEDDIHTATPRNGGHAAPLGAPLPPVPPSEGPHGDAGPPALLPLPLGDAGSRLDLSSGVPEDLGEGPPEGLTFAPIDTSARRFRTNVLANLAYFIFSAGIQLWFTRYLIDQLGVATYGLVPLATNITNYMTIVTIALSGSVGRFLTIDLAKGDIAAANRTFNTALFASVVLAIALVPVAGALSWFGPNLLNIPAGEEMGTRFLLMCTCFAFLLNAVGSSFACSTFAKNRFDVQRLIDAVGFAFQVAVIFALFAASGSRLWYVGIGIAGSALVRQACYQASWRKLTPELHIRRCFFARSCLRQILGMSGWLSVDNIGVILLFQADLVLANGLLGPEASGLYAPLLQVSILLKMVVDMAASALAPTVIATYTTQGESVTATLVSRTTRVLGLFLGLPIGLVCGLGGPLLNAWLGPPFADQGLALAVLMAPAVFTRACATLHPVKSAANKVRTPAIAVLITGVVSVMSSVAAVRAFGGGLLSLIAIRSVTWFLLDVCFTTIYVALVLHQPPSTFVRRLAPGGIGALLVASGVRALICIPGPRPVLAALLPFGLLISLAYATVVWHYTMSSEDRAILARSLRGGRRAPQPQAHL